MTDIKSMTQEEMAAWLKELGNRPFVLNRCLPGSTAGHIL